MYDSNYLRGGRDFSDVEVYITPLPVVCNVNLGHSSMCINVVPSGGDTLSRILNFFILLSGHHWTVIPVIPQIKLLAFKR